MRYDAVNWGEKSVPTVIYDETEIVDIPIWVVNLRTFQRWLDSDQFPERGKVWFIRGEVWADMSWEQVFTHGQVKNAIAFRLTAIVQREKIGRYFPDACELSIGPLEYRDPPTVRLCLLILLRRARLGMFAIAKEESSRFAALPIWLSRSSVRVPSARIQSGFKRRIGRPAFPSTGSSMLANRHCHFKF